MKACLFQSDKTHSNNYGLIKKTLYTTTLQLKIHIYLKKLKKDSKNINLCF